MKTVSSQTFHLLSLLRLKGVGPAALKKAVLLPGFDRMRLEELAAAVPQIARSLEGGANWQEAQDWAHAQVVAADRHNARILSAIDDEYPALLAATKDDPFIIYVQGTLAKPEQRSLAIIGTREPTQHGAVVARRITTHFGEAGWSIVSGLAIGCDGLAHQAALDCGAHTVAVMAHGLQMTAPAKHKSLAQAILASGGALVSEYPFGQAVQSQQYVKRDRTQAGMALGVVMIQSDLKGGSLYASRATLEYGRWLAVPYPTPKDLENNEPKVQANLVIAEALPHGRADLLRCPLSALERVIVLRNKDDYRQLAESNGIAFTKGESSIRHIHGVDADVSGERTEATGDFFSQSFPQPEPPRLKEPTNSEPTAAADEFNAIEAGVVAELVLSVSNIDASPGDAVPSEIGSAPEPSDAPTAEESPPVDDLSLEHEPAGTESAQTPGSEKDTQPAEAAKASASEAMEPNRRIQLEVGLSKDDEVGTAFGLWLPPKIGSKDFKKWLGDSADDMSVRDFYARHRRLHTHLADLQRKLLRVKGTLSHDQVLALSLVSEEVVLHLSKLASSSLKIEELSKTERLRKQKEDWIEQDQAGSQPLEPGIGEASKSRSKLAEDSSVLLSGNLKFYVIDGKDSDSGESPSEGDTKRFTLRELVQRLNSVLLSTF